MSLTINDYQRLFSFYISNPVYEEGGIDQVIRKTIEDCVPLLKEFALLGTDAADQKIASDTLRGLFHACYLKTESLLPSDETKNKTSQLFNDIITQSCEEPQPKLYVQEELYNAVMRCWHPFWDDFQYHRDHFLERKNNEKFLEGSQFVYTMLLSDSLGLDLKSCSRLAYHFGLLYIAQIFKGPTQEGLMEDVANLQFQLNQILETGAIEEVFNKVILHPFLRNNILEVITILDRIEDLLNKELKEDETGEIKKEFLASILENEFWSPLKDILELNLPEHEFVENVSALFSRLTDKNHTQGMIQSGLKRMIEANIYAKCNPLEIKTSLLDHLAQSMGPNVTQTEMIREFCRRCQVPEVAEDILRLHLKLTDNNRQSKEVISGTISSLILIYSSIKNLNLSLDPLINQMRINRAFNSLYSIGFEQIAGEMVDEANNSVRKSIIKLPEWLRKFHVDVLDGINLFNAEKEPLHLNYYEIYELIAKLILDAARESSLAFFNDSDVFPQECPKTENRMLKITQNALQDYFNRRYELTEGDYFRSQGISADLESLSRYLTGHRFKEAIFSELNNICEIRKREKDWHEANDVKKEPPTNLTESIQSKDKHISVSFDVQTTNKLGNIDLTLGITQQEVSQKGKEAVKKAPSKKEPLRNEQSYQIVSDVVEGLEEQYNDSAFEHLKKQLFSDSSITLNVAQQFETNWKGDKSLYGEDIAKGKGFLTVERCERILKEARHISKVKEMNVALEKFKRQLNKDASEGKVIPKQEVIKARYAGFFDFVRQKIQGLTEPEKKKWQLGYDRIVTDTLIIQEMRKLETNPKKVSGSFIENKLLELRKLGARDDLQKRNERHEAEVGVLKTLLEGKGLVGKDLEAVKQKVEAIKREARLKAVGVPELQLKGYVAIISTLEIIHDQMIKDIQTEKMKFNSLPNDYPKQHRDWLLEIKASQINKAIHSFFIKEFKRLATDEIFAKLIAANSEEIQKSIIEMFEPLYAQIKSGNLSEATEMSLDPYIAFHKKWRHRIKGEMIQGQADKQEALGEGVCAGVAGRWAINDQSFPKAKIEELADPQKLKVSPSDRLRQGFHSIACIFKGLFSNSNAANIGPYQQLIEVSYPKAYREGLGIKEVNLLFNVSGELNAQKEDFAPFTPKELDQFKTQLKGLGDTLKSSNGVVTLSLSLTSGGHRIYLRFDIQDNKNQVFRLGEPNIGLLELNSEQEFFDCFNDLCNVMYNKEVNSTTVFQCKL